MLSDLYIALLTLFSASTAVGMAYLALPDYRYRNSISEYLEHRIRYRFSSYADGQFKERNGKLTFASEINPEVIVQQCVKRHSRKIGGEPEWLLTLMLMLYLPRGHVPTDCTLLKEKQKENNYPNWFQKIPGKMFVWLYLTHWDNRIVTWLTAISLAVTIGILCDVVFVDRAYQEITADSALAENNAIQSTSVIIAQFKEFLFLVGIAGFIIPAALAAVARLYICKHARSEINVAVNKMLNDNREPVTDGFSERAARD